MKYQLSIFFKRKKAGKILLFFFNYFLKLFCFNSYWCFFKVSKS